MRTDERLRTRETVRRDERGGSARRSLHELTPEFDDEPSEEPAAPAWFAVARGAALFFGCVTLLQLLGEMRFPHFRSADWWIDLHPLAKPAARTLLGLSAILLVFFSFFPRSNTGLRRVAALCALALFGASLWNAYGFYQQLRSGRIHTDLPLPFSLHVAGSLLVILAGLLAARWERSNFGRDCWVGLLTLAVCVAGFPLAQFYCFGKVNGRGPADAVIVLADAVEAETRPASPAEQVRAACALFRDIPARKFVVVAPGGDASQKAADAMRRLAIEGGIAEADLVVQCAGPEADAAVAAAAKSLQEQQISRVLIAGPFYKLPRMKLCCERAGLEAHTVPVREEIRQDRLRSSLIREATALWQCYLQPLLM